MDKITTVGLDLAKQVVAVHGVAAPLQETRALHQRDLAGGQGAVYLPDAPALKHPHGASRGGRGVISPLDRLKCASATSPANT